MRTTGSATFFCSLLACSTSREGTPGPDDVLLSVLLAIADVDSATLDDDVKAAACDHLTALLSNKPPAYGYRPQERARDANVLATWTEEIEAVHARHARPDMTMARYKPPSGLLLAPFAFLLFWPPDIAPYFYCAAIYTLLSIPGSLSSTLSFAITLARSFRTRESIWQNLSIMYPLAFKTPLPSSSWLVSRTTSSSALGACIVLSLKSSRSTFMAGSPLRQEHPRAGRIDQAARCPPSIDAGSAMMIDSPDRGAIPPLFTPAPSSSPMTAGEG